MIWRHTSRLVNYARSWPCGRNIFPDVHLWPWLVARVRASKRDVRSSSTTYPMKSFEWYAWSLSISLIGYRQGTSLITYPALWYHGIRAWHRLLVTKQNGLQTRCDLTTAESRTNTCTIMARIQCIKQVCVLSTSPACGNKTDLPQG